MKKTEIFPIKSLEPGMVVAVAVADAAGRILLPAGVVLAESSIAGLERRGIAEISIELDVAEAPEALELRQQQVKRQLDRLFRLAGQEPEALALYETIAKYRMEQGS